jgi:DNA processing protein
MALNTGRVVGIVGTRNATHYGRQVCEEIISSFEGKQITVVSGLALGIDGIAHKACVDNGIQTIGVLGHGLEMVYPPQHERLADQMCINGGLLTEFPYKTKPDAMNFPMRNRIVAGMCDAVIVVESDVRGGSLITCNLANDYGKEVFAIPGSVFSKYSRGCHKMIAENKASVFTGFESFMTTMNWSRPGFVENKQLELWHELQPTEQGILQFLREKKQASLDVLSVVQQIPMGQISGLLLTLEIAGFVKALPGKLYALSDRMAS